MHLVLRLRSGMQVLVEALAGKTIALDVGASGNIDNAKAKIQTSGRYLARPVQQRHASSSSMCSTRSALLGGQQQAMQAGLVTVL